MLMVMRGAPNESFGRSSRKEKFDKFVSLGAVTLILSLEFPPGDIEAGKNDLLPITLVPAIVTLAFAGDRLRIPSAVVKVLLGIVLVATPDGGLATAITGTEMIQVPGDAGLPPGISAPDRVTLVDVEVTVPGGTQVLVTVPFTFNPEGKLSVTFTPV